MRRSAKQFVSPASIGSLVRQAQKIFTLQIRFRFLAQIQLNFLFERFFCLSKHKKFFLWISFFQFYQAGVAIFFV